MARPVAASRYVNGWPSVWRVPARQPGANPGMTPTRSDTDQWPASATSASQAPAVALS